MVLMAIGLRLVAMVPPPIAVPDAAAAVLTSPFMALLDTFSGGAAARPTLTAFGLVPYAIAVFLLQPLRYGNRWRSAAAAIALTAIIAAIFAGFFWYYLEQAGVLTQRGLDDFAAFVLMLVAGAFLPVSALWLCYILWPRCLAVHLFGRKPITLLDVGLANTTIANWITAAFTVNLIVTIPGYIVAGVTTPSQIAWRIVTLFVSALLLLTLSLGSRKVQVGIEKIPHSSNLNSRPAARPSIPIAPFVLDLSPLYVVLVILGAINSIAQILGNWPIPWISRLAHVEQNATDPTGWLFWIVLTTSGVLVLYLVREIRITSAVSELQRVGQFIPGVQPGSNTLNYIKRVSAAPFILGGIAQMVILAFPAILAMWLDDRGAWSLLLFPIALVLDQFKRLYQMLHAAVLSSTYQGLIRRPPRH